MSIDRVIPRNCAGSIIRLAQREHVTFVGFKSTHQSTGLCSSCRHSRSFAELRRPSTNQPTRNPRIGSSHPPVHINPCRAAVEASLLKDAAAHHLNSSTSRSVVGFGRLGWPRDRRERGRRRRHSPLFHGPSVAPTRVAVLLPGCPVLTFLADAASRSPVHLPQFVALLSLLPRNPLKLGPHPRRLAAGLGTSPVPPIAPTRVAGHSVNTSRLYLLPRGFLPLGLY